MYRVHIMFLLILFIKLSAHDGKLQCCRDTFLLSFYFNHKGLACLGALLCYTVRSHDSFRKFKVVCSSSPYTLTNFQNCLTKVPFMTNTCLHTGTCTSSLNSTVCVYSMLNVNFKKISLHVTANLSVDRHFAYS